MLRAVGPGGAESAPRVPERPPNNLPVEITSLVGREREIAEIEGLLAGRSTRLLTLTGPGGSGKTRLAVAVASEVVEGFEDGAWWVGLSPLSEPALVPQAVARAVMVSEHPGVPLADTLAEYLRERELLLILDNCEHLVGACAELVDSLLRSCKRLRILATSREPLGVAGEADWRVPSLAVPDRGRPHSIAEATGYEAVALFVERAGSRDSTFYLTNENSEAVAELCRRLEGIPLAIELAAARTKVLSVGQILTRLDDSLKVLVGKDRTAPERQRTLRGALDWSYELLEEPERKLLGRLSVFAGGFSLEAAEAVGSTEGVEEGDGLEVLSGLVDKSMVVAEAGPEGTLRYRMLEPVRQYGLERLEGRGETEEVRERHAAFFLALAEEAEPELMGPEQGAWLERLEPEHDNFRAAISWALEDDEPEGRAEVGLALAAALAQGRFWNAYGPGEGRRWLDRGLAGSGASSTPLRAKALKEAGWLANYHGDPDRSVALLEESMSLFEELGDKPGVAASLLYLGMTALHGGDHARARTLYREAEALRQESEDRRTIGSLLTFLGMVALSEGDHDRSVALTGEGLALNRELGDMRGTAICLIVLGMTALELDDPDRAAALYEEEMHMMRGLRDKVGTSYGLRGMACVAALRNQPTRAARVWGADEALREAIALPISLFDRIHPDYEGLLNAVRPQLDDAAWEAARAEGREMTPEEAIQFALLEGEQAAPPPTPKETASLSARELEVLRLVAEGLTDSQVAERLYLSPRTVGFHLRSIYRKLGVPSRAAAAKAAVERSLI